MGSLGAKSQPGPSIVSIFRPLRIVPTGICPGPTNVVFPFASSCTKYVVFEYDVLIKMLGIDSKKSKDNGSGKSCNDFLRYVLANVWPKI